MAIVKNQTIPTTDNEDALDPPIEFVKQYRRLLSEGVDHPKLGAGYEMVAYNKRESRPSQRTLWKYYNKPMSEAWREVFKDCLACWKTFVDTDEELDDCYSRGSKHYFKPWEYWPGAILTWFNAVMKLCLDWQVLHPGTKYPPCEDLEPSPSLFQYCPGDVIDFTVANGNTPNIAGLDCGEISETLQITVEGDPGLCPQACQVKFIDADGRRGCAYGTRKPDMECCCAVNDTLAISYTSLEIGCEEVQQLSADPQNPGCPPYTWEISGGGFLEANQDGTATYTAPDTNEGCAFNPTITLKDSCNKSASIQIAVNCFSSETPAYTIYQWVDEGQDAGCNATDRSRWGLYGYAYRCDGTLIEGCNYTTYCTCGDPSAGGTVCLQGGTGEAYCGGPPGGDWACRWTSPFSTYCSGDLPSPHALPAQGQSWDQRTTPLREAGCCPLNPYTGLPF
jgi:hypothetical protein